MRMLRLPAIVAGTLLALFLIHAANAQTKSTATLTGTITDPSGAVVADASIAAQSPGSTQIAGDTHSGPDGNFALALPPGRYRVRIQIESFASVERELEVAAGDNPRWDVRLQLAALSSSVIVTAQAEPAQATNVIAPADVITRDEIEQRQEIWLTPLLASAPGVSFSQLGPIGGTTSLFLDGGNSNYTKVLVDGTPVNQPGGAIDLSNLTAESVDKIEIVHGASSALYGSDAMDGVVQLFTHRGSTPTPQLTLEGDGGTFGTGHGSGQLSGLLDAFDYSLDAGYFSSDGQGPGDYARDTTLSGNFGYKFSDTDSLRLTVRNNASDAGQPGQTLFPTVPFAVDIGQHSDLHDLSSNLTWDLAPTDHWQNQFSGYESRFQEAVTSPAFSPLPFNSSFNRAGFNDQSTYIFQNGGVTAGYVYEVENGGAQARHNQAGYVEIRYNLRPRLSVVAGGRVEANGFFGTRTVPRIGAAYELRSGRGFWGDTRLRASYGEGIKEPELFPADCTPVLKPEQSSTVDAGMDQFFASNRVKMTVTFFHNDFHDIVSFEFGGASPTCPAFGGSFFNTDKARAFGSNSSIEVKVAKWLNFTANYSYDDSRVLSSPGAFDPALVPGNRLLKRPLNSANVALDARWRGVNWNLSGYYVGTRTDSDFLGLGFTRDPGYVRWDMSASAPIRHGVSFDAHFANLLDRHYQDAIGYPALGYNYRVGIKYVWGGEK
jgi:vitamin B12 transporter